MKTFLVLEDVDEGIQTVEWGCVPEEWNVPCGEYMKHFELVGITRSGFFWWKKMIGHYKKV